MKIRTGFFGGSFNPIHEGHISLARYICDKNLVDEIWFVVSPQNPLKTTADPEDARKRYEKVVAELRDKPSFTASDIELNMPLPSYTSDTLRYVSEKYSDREFVLIIGGDNLDKLSKWKDYEYILKNYDIIVYPRPGASNRIPARWTRVTMLDAPLMDISSTQIREGK